MNSVEVTASNAAGNAVQRTTRMKISQTWFASQTGPMQRSIRPPSPFAPFAGAAEQVPHAGAEVGSAEHGVEGHANPENGCDGVGLAHAGPPPVAGGRLVARPVRHLDVGTALPRRNAAMRRRITIVVVPSRA